MSTPNPIDVHAGQKLRMRRVLMGVSLEKIGEAVGLTFQQIQKYENGKNRMSASRLAQLAVLLQVEPAYFFEGAPKPTLVGGAVVEAHAADAKMALIVGSLGSAEGQALNRDFARIRDPKVRRRIVDLVAALAGEDVVDEEAPKPALAA